MNPSGPSFYRRPLPESLVPFASAEGRAIFREALQEGTMEGFFELAEQFHTQSEPAFCSLGTLVVVLNALAIDPGRQWKGPWRWFAEEHLDCCRPLDQVKETGTTLAQLVCLARCNGARVELRSASEASVDDLRAAARAACRVPGEPHLIASYDRSVLGQTGTGHFSPIGGYHGGRDLLLVLDVARFKYPPHWVPVAQMFEAMRSVDPTSQRSRGWALLSRGDRDAPFDGAGLESAVRCALDTVRARGLSAQGAIDPAAATILVNALTHASLLPPDVRADLEALRSVLSTTP